MGYICYLIATQDGSRTYVGITNNAARRIRQHRGEISGGAAATAGHCDWQYVWWVTGFGTNHERCLSFEWHAQRRATGGTELECRRKVVDRLLGLDRWCGLELCLDPSGVGES